MRVVGIFRPIARVCALLALLIGCSSAVPQGSSNIQHQGSTMEINEHKQRFEALLQLRDTDFAAERKKFLADAASVAYLKQRFDDPDRVVAFIARELYSWAAELPKEYAALETFFQITEPALRKANKTAAGGGGSEALNNYLDPYLENQKVVAAKLMNHLLLRTLMQPKLQPYIYIVLQQYYSFFPVPEPEVWIRISLQVDDPMTFDFLAEKSLPLLDQQNLKQAFEHERARAVRAKLQWPTQFDKLRKTLP